MELGAIEREIRGESAALRTAARRERAVPLLNELRAWLIATRATLSVKCPLAGAIQYTRGRWEALTRYVEDGRIESVFALNGVGLLAWNAIQRSDFPVIQAIVLIVAILFVALNFFSDMINGLLDPRIRVS